MRASRRHDPQGRGSGARDRRQGGLRLRAGRAAHCAAGEGARRAALLGGAGWGGLTGGARAGAHGGGGSAAAADEDGAQQRLQPHLRGRADGPLHGPGPGALLRPHRRHGRRHRQGPPRRRILPPHRRHPARRAPRAALRRPGRRGPLRWRPLPLPHRARAAGGARARRPAQGVRRCHALPDSRWRCLRYLVLTKIRLTAGRQPRDAHMKLVTCSYRLLQMPSCCIDYFAHLSSSLASIYFVRIRVFAGCGAAISRRLQTQPSDAAALQPTGKLMEALIWAHL